MYDWVKMATYSPLTKSFLLNNTKLNFTADVNIDTGEVKPINEHGTIRRVAEDHSLSISIYDGGRIEIKGSLHQFYNSVINGKAYNYNLFTLNDAVHAIELIQTMYGVIPEETSIHNLETGVNIMPKLNISVNKILDYVKAYKHLKFNAMDIRTEGKGKKVVLNQYKVKVYDKGTHQGAKDDILRYEIGYFKMQAIGSSLKLSDLTNSDLWIRLSDELIKSLERILFTDSFDLQQLTVPEKRLFAFCNNPDEWEQSERTKRSKAKTKFESLIQAKGQYKFCNLFTELLREQINLMSVKTCNNFTELEKRKKQQFYHLSIGEKGCNSTSEHSTIYNDDSSLRNSNTLRCLITGLSMNLESEKKQVRCIGVTTVRWLKSNNNELYELLKMNYLPRTKGYTKKEPDDVTLLAKQIRNEATNSIKHKDKAPRKVPANQISIFN